MVLAGLRAERFIPNSHSPNPYSPSSNPTTLADTSRVVDLDEVVIVPQPKESGRLRTQPLSSTLFSGADLTRLQLHDVREISRYVPTFVMPEYGSRYTSSAYIRGIGAREGGSAIGMYVDGIPLVTKSMYNFHTYGMGRVDVLRGAQGTLYGMNSEGGLVRMYSRNPMNYQGTDVSLRTGSYVLRNVEAAHYHKLSDTLAFSVAAFSNGQNGFQRNSSTGQWAELVDEAGGKVRLVWQPMRTLSFDYTADYQWVKQNGFPYGQLNLADGHVARPSSDYQARYRRHLFTTGLSLKWTAAKFVLNSTTSFQYLRDHMRMDIDYTQADLMRMNQHQRQRALTQEVTLKNPDPQDRWQWATGAFLSVLWHGVDAPVSFRPGMNNYLSQTIENAAYNGILMVKTPAEIEALGGVHIRMDIDDPIFGHFKTPQQNLGLFHESNYKITDRLTATAGLRYDMSHAVIDYHTGGVAHVVANVLGTAVDDRVTDILSHREDNLFNQLLPKVALKYSMPARGLVDEGHFYATFSKGYRAGGYNVQSFGDILQYELRTSAPAARTDVTLAHSESDYARIADAISYKPETSWNYELGTHLNLFGQRLQLDAAVYYMEVHNQQVSKFAGNYGYGRMTVNAAKSYSCGMELSLRGQAVDNRLSYNVAYGYTHAAFKRFDDTIDGVSVSYKGNRAPFVPEHTLAASIAYRLPLALTAMRALTFGADMTARSQTYWDEANSYDQGAYATLGGHVRLDFARDITVTLWGRNLTNTRYNTFAFDSSATGTQLYFAQRAMPWQLGLTLAIHF